MHPVDVHGIGAPVWWALASLGLLCTAWAYVLHFRLIADIGPMKALTVTLVIPVFGVFWGWLLLDEPVAWTHAAGGALIALALWLVVWPDSLRCPARLRSLLLDR